MDDGANVADNNGFPKPEGTSTGGKGTGRGCRRRRWRRIGLALALLLAVVGMMAWLLGDGKPSGPPLILITPSGEKYQFVGTTYGTRNVPPSFEAKLVSVLPARLANWARKYVGPEISQFNNGNKFDPPNLFIWFQRMGTNVPVRTAGPPLTARLSDQAGIEAGAGVYPPGFESSVAWHYASFSVIPRRSRVLELNFYSYGGSGDLGNLYRPTGSISIPNPLYGNYPEWKPEPVPAVKKAGDLEVRLDEFTTGTQIGGGLVAKANGSRGLPVQAPAKGRDRVTGFDFSLRSARGTNEVWVLESAELGDATGNVISSRSFMSSYLAFEGHARRQLTEWAAYTESIPGTLWPDEAAWRLKLEFKRASGFAPQEVVTFKNVPVPAMGTTNYPGFTKKAGGIKVVLTEFARRPNLTIVGGGLYSMTTYVTAELPGKPKGVAIDFLSMKADAGQAEQYGSSEPDNFSYRVLVTSIPTNAKTMDFTFVVQKTRAVEFLVQPPKGE
jgi:hypothetical protein